MKLELSWIFRKIWPVLSTRKLVLLIAGLVFLAGCAAPSPIEPPTVAVVESPAPAPVVEAPPVEPQPPTNAPTNAAPVIAAPVVVPPKDTPPAPPPPVVVHHPPPLKGWVGWEDWTNVTGFGKPIRLTSVSSWTYELKSPTGSLELTAGNRTAVWNGLNVELGFAPHFTNGELRLHSLDVIKTLAPLSSHVGSPFKPGKIVVIDPGHGGDNYGAKSAVSERREKEFALDWALRLAPLLRAHGWQVFLTRTNDVEISLSNRVAVADSVKADLFISLHFNSTDQPQGHSDHGGIETYCLTPVGMPSTLTRHFEDETNHLYPNNAFDSENFYYAARLQRALVEATGRKDRGVRRARFMGALRGQNRPAVLLEAGYLTYPSEAQLISTASYRQKLAEAVAAALCD